MRRVRRHPQAAAMGIDDRSADGSPMPMPSGFVVKKGSNIRSMTSGIHPRTGVLYRDQHAAGLGECRNRRLRGLRYPAHRFRSSFVIRFRITCCNCTRSPMTGWSFAPARCPARHYAAAIRCGRVLSTSPMTSSMSSVALAVWISRQRAHTADHVVRAMPSRSDAGTHFAHLVKVGAIAVQPPQAGLAVGHHGGDRLVDLMRD